MYYKERGNAADSSWLMIHGKIQNCFLQLWTIDHGLSAFFRIFTSEWQKMKLYWG